MKFSPKFQVPMNGRTIILYGYTPFEMKFSIDIDGGVKSNVHLVSPSLENKSLLLEHLLHNLLQV